MYVIEAHDSALDDEEQGTLAGRAGRQGTIAYPYQVEMFIQDILERGEWRRLYVLLNGKALAVWHRPDNSLDADDLRLVAKKPLSDDWTWKPAFVNPASTRLVIENFGPVGNLDEGHAWAEAQLRDETVATAILMREESVYAAWERDEDGTVVLIARGPGAQ